MTAPLSSDEVDEAGVEDILVFARSGDGFRLVGGTGRGVGWADIVDVRIADEPVVERALRAGIPIRIGAAEPVRVVGPYWATTSAVVPVGQEHLVVFGGSAVQSISSGRLLGAAARLVGETHDVAPEKLLADELELVHAVRALMAYRAETVRDTARHIALVAARALSCDVAAIHVAFGDPAALEMLRIGGSAEFESDASVAGPDAPDYLSHAGRLTGPLVEQSVDPGSRVWQDEIVSRLTLPIGGGQPLGALSLGHAAAKPRGFTQLCQRIGLALAEAAELLLSQAIAREQLAAERDVLRHVSLTDALTGVGNRAAWDRAVGALGSDQGAGRTFAVVSTDVDELKAMNDRYGHATGDAVIRGAADLLRSSIREGDTIARIGGDEFLVLLRDTDDTEARQVVRRIRRSLRSWCMPEHGLAPTLSVGWATGRSDPAAVTRLADERMYRTKRRRAGIRASRGDVYHGPGREAPPPRVGLDDRFIWTSDGRTSGPLPRSVLRRMLRPWQRTSRSRSSRASSGERGATSRPTRHRVPPGRRRSSG